MKVKLHIFLSKVLDVDGWAASLPPDTIPGAHQIGGWVYPRAGQNALDI